MQRTMMRAAALIDAGEGQPFERVGDLLQMALGEMEILGRGLQIFMSQQQLNGAQVGAGFEKMRGPTVSNQMGRYMLANTGPLGGLVAGQPYDLV
jgi:hypothetical protein